MKRPLFVKPLTQQEQEALQLGLRSKEAFTLRRSQIIRLSSKGQKLGQIAKQLGCASQTVRNVIHEFEHRDMEVLQVQ